MKTGFSAESMLWVDPSFVTPLSMMKRGIPDWMGDGGAGRQLTQRLRKVSNRTSLPNEGGAISGSLKRWLLR